LLDKVKLIHDVGQTAAHGHRVYVGISHAKTLRPYPARR
jgi:hypothetical protein